MGAEAQLTLHAASGTLLKVQTPCCHKVGHGSAILFTVTGGHIIEQAVDIACSLLPPEFDYVIPPNDADMASTGKTQ